MKLNVVPARTGMLWAKLGIRTFLRQPLALTGLFFMYTAVGSLLSLVPLIGVVLALAIVPGATLGLMAATREAEAGRVPTPMVLVSAFRAGRQRLRAMLVLGGVYAALFLGIVALVSLLVDVPSDSGADSFATPGMQHAMLLGSVLYLPVSLLFWHAPALVHWHSITPAKSLFFSAVACVRNGGAFLVYGLVWLAIGVLAFSLVLAAVAATGSSTVAATALMPVALLLSAMFSTSLYFTFRDCFVAEPAPEADAAGEETT